MASEIRVNKITHTAGVGTITTSADGINIVGIATAITFSGSGASLTSIPAGNLTGALPSIDGSNLTGITGTTINNNADNRLITGSGTANTLNGESTLTYDGTNLDLGDSKKIRLGDSQDLELYHNGSHSYLTNSTGTLILQTSNSGEIQLNGNGQHAAKFNPTGTSYIYYNGSLRFSIGATNTVHSEDFVPGANNTYDLGSSGSRWRNVYTTDLQLSNKGKTNDVDGTWGDWTLQEGEDKIFMINNRTGKKYSLKMEEE
tara:strand:+ start:98 stop:874 length:777 start_codon:yes stop_codon:yes gene_type:complete